MKKRGLGRGIGELMRELNENDSHLAFSSSLDDSGGEFKKLPIEYLKQSPFQPRRDIDKSALEELAESIKIQGIIQPIIVRKKQDKDYEIIAGERRWRAAQLAQLREVPTLVKDISDHMAFAIALIENIQRENLNPLEEAYALDRLIKEFKMTHAEIAKTVGKSRATVTNFLRLLGLNENVKQLMEQGFIEMGHARSLLALNKNLQNQAAKTVVSKRLSVRETENLVKRLLNPQVKKNKSLAPDVKHLQDRLSEKLGAKVFIQYDKKGKGKLIIQYNSLDELDGILKHIK